MVSTSISYVWPTAPYKGLSFYGPEDAPLFAGREIDVRQCADVLANQATRILILHGTTGCGKSSFLRAGLIPFLETDTAGFQFVKESARKYKALFVRSTDRPLVKLAESIYELASASMEANTFIGQKTLKLSSIILPYESRTEFLNAVATDPEVIVKALGAIATKLPRTLVLVIDQGEEMITLSPGEEGEISRNEFFEFISLFGKNKFDLKLLITLRTEFYGRFVNRFLRGVAAVSGMRDYFLSDFTKGQLISAITRPTLEQNVDGYGRPYDHYNFSFAPGLPEKIADDLKDAGLTGGVLPVMQIVCDNLYRVTRTKQDKSVITGDDYSSLGGIEGQISKHLDRVLEQLCRGRISDRKTSQEAERWKDVLSGLAKYQVDGTVTTEILKAEDLREKAVRAGCELPFQYVADYLCDDERRILRHTEVINFKTGTLTHCYSLGHDAIGLVLKRWVEEIQRIKSLDLRQRLVFISLAAAFLLVATAVWLVAPEMRIVSEILLFAISAPLVILASTPRIYLERVFLPAVFYPYALFKRLPVSFQRRLIPVSVQRKLIRDRIIPDDPYNRNVRYSMAAVFAAVGFFGLLQTQWFLSLLPYPDMATIHKNINITKELQSQIGTRYAAQTGREPERGIIISSLFGYEARKALEEETESLLRDDSLQTELKENFGNSFRDVNAVIIPSWALANPVNDDLFGLTLAGGAQARSAGDNQGFTLRDRDPDVQVTFDGRPRIVIRTSAFESAKALRLTLFHELLHAMNVPGYYPSRLIILQDDLTYLPQYRSLVSRLQLKGWRETRLWIFWVLAPWAVSLLIALFGPRRTSPISLKLRP